MQSYPLGPIPLEAIVSLSRWISGWESQSVQFASEPHWWSSLAPFYKWMGLLKEWVCIISWASTISASFLFKLRHLSNLSALYPQRCVAHLCHFWLAKLLCQSSCWWTELHCRAKLSMASELPWTQWPDLCLRRESWLERVSGVQ